ncbi:DUF4097 family beta strand repeat protein [Fulvivirga sp. 29W222]|uniref:DUF4097 family beta strand repeat protein n=1 Tax=Fulvivirga marina TaxID=2494733 RepID=A0A937KD22_9BACT|nr:DUF4097 family beta strand repeat-containing protein [Fulvivirga marina]MBL6448142.1 DUF4097 family beta strand repeat protein [Fulvivirga marina]
MKKITTTILTCCLAGTLFAQSYSEKILREIAFEQQSIANVLYLANINGSIHVEAYDGQKIIVEAEKKVRAKTNERMERSKHELSLGVLDRYDTIIVFIKGPCGTLNYKEDQRGKGYNWNNCEYDYEFKFDFTLKVPKDLNLYLSTINEGDVEVNGVLGSLNVNNVNGAITLKQVSGLAKVHTINGDVTMEYQNLPKEPSTYYTLNGDINALFPKGLKADMTFKSFNGDFYTNIKQLEYKSATVEKKSMSKSGGLEYKVDSRYAISVGGGGVTLDFETFNGDVTIKEKQ